MIGQLSKDTTFEILHDYRTSVRTSSVRRQMNRGLNLQCFGVDSQEAGIYVKNGRKLIGQALIGLITIALLLLALAIIGSRVNGFGVRRSSIPIIAPSVTMVAGTNEFRQ